jgi:hypothetical protein
MNRWNDWRDPDTMLWVLLYAMLVVWFLFAVAKL